MDSVVTTPTAALHELFPEGPEATPPITEEELAIFIRLVHCEMGQSCPVAFYRMETLHNPDRTERTLTTQRETNKTGIALVHMDATGFDAARLVADQYGRSAPIGDTWEYTTVDHDFFKRAQAARGVKYFSQFAHPGYSDRDGEAKTALTALQHKKLASRLLVLRIAG